MTFTTLPTNFERAMAEVKADRHEISKLQAENAALRKKTVEPADDIRDLLSLKAENARLRKELDRAKQMPMKYRRMEFNAQLQKESDELREQLAAIETALVDYRGIEVKLSDVVGRVVEAYKESNKTASKFMGELNDCEKQLAAAQADAKRYRWLTDGIDHEIDIASWDGEQWCCNYMDKVAIDAAIDDAIAKEQS